MKYFHLAVIRQIESGFYAYCVRVTNLDNIAARFRDFYAANVCDSKKHAAELAAAWNAQFIANGTHAFMNDHSEPEDDPENAVLPF